MTMAIFGRTLHHEGKISPAWWGGGTPALFHSVYKHVQSCGVLYFSSIPVLYALYAGETPR
jgi:hypothetical protein